MIEGLYDVFKNWSAKGSVYIISDPHFSDTESFEFRKAHGKLPDGVSSVEDLDDYIVKNINSVVHKNDTLVCLGDVGNIEYIKKLKAGYKVLLRGNHDQGKSYYKKEVHRDFKLGDEFPEELTYEDILKLGYKEVDATPTDFIFEKVTDNGLFDEVYPGTLTISDKIILSHEPIIPCPDYLVNLCGHVHDRPHKFKIYRHQYYNFCAEAINYKPVSLGKLIKEGMLSKVKDIHRVTVDGAIIRKSIRKRHKAEQ